MNTFGNSLAGIEAPERFTTDIRARFSDMVSEAEECQAAVVRHSRDFKDKE